MGKFLLSLYILGAVFSASGVTTSTQAAILGVASSAKALGSGSEVGPNIVHANGNVYGQILLQGSAATVTADPLQVLRIAYVDLNNDIVQVEFSGAGTMSLVLDSASGPAAPVNYKQSTVSYMKGHASIVITGANESTNVSVFSVGRTNAVNQALFRSDVTYDGHADIAFIAILSSNGKLAACGHQILATSTQRALPGSMRQTCSSPGRSLSAIFLPSTRRTRSWCWAPPRMCASRVATCCRPTVGRWRSRVSRS